MIVKGIVSAVNSEAQTIDVILPEYGGIVTKPIKVYGKSDVSSLNINDFVLVVFFNDNFSDGLAFVSIADAVSAISIIDSLTSTSSSDGLSANQGNVLYNMIQTARSELSDEAISNIELEAILK